MGIVTFASVELIHVVLKNVKSKRDKIESGRSCSYVKKHSSYLFTTAAKPKGDISLEPIRGQKIEVDTDVDLRNGGKRVSLTSDATAEER